MNGERASRRAAPRGAGGGRMRRWVRVLAIVASLSLLAAACGGDEDGGADALPEGEFDGVTITFSTSLAETELPAIQQLLDTFQESTGATVELTQVESSALPQKLQVEVDSGNHTVHLFAQDNLALRVLVDDELVEDLSDVEIPEGVTPALIPEQFDGEQYFLPYRPN